MSLSQSSGTQGVHAHVLLDGGGAETLSLTVIDDYHERSPHLRRMWAEHLLSLAQVFDVAEVAVPGEDMETEERVAPSVIAGVLHMCLIADAPRPARV